MYRNCLIAVAALSLLGQGVTPAGQTVYQKGRAFSIAEMTVRRGESVVFLNDDTVPHNVVSASGGNGFDLGQQPPNHATPVTFTLAGTVVVVCAIHPRMRMVIQVTD